MPTNVQTAAMGFTPPPPPDPPRSQRQRKFTALLSPHQLRALLVALTLSLSATPVDSACYAPAGYYCTSSSAAYPTRCGQGYYQPSAGQSSCGYCGSAGLWCTQFNYGWCSSHQYTFSGNRWKTCHNCPPGYYCNGSTATKVSYGYYTTGSATGATGCAAGRYCPSIAQAYNPTCPSGHYSSSNARYCTQTSGGYQSTGSSQAACSAGYYARRGESGCSGCPAGFYCAAGQEIPLPCPGGTYSTGYASSCTACPYQQYCSTTALLGVCSNGYTSPAGSPVCTLCQPGYWCQSGAQTACSTNQYSLKGSSSCTSAVAGYNKDSLKASIGTLCNAGYYSNSGTGYVCTICPQGYYCPQDGSGLYTTAYVCGASYYCPKGSSYYQTCPDWYDCTNYRMCPDGQYLHSDKVTCLNCPAGQTCKGRSWSTNTVITTAGYYSPVGVSVQLICPAGFACSTNVAVECAWGQYSIEGDMYCNTCAVNWACPNKDLAQSDQIYCPFQRGMYQPSTGQTECIIAPAGTYIQYGQTSPTTCPSGTWSAGASEACMECPPGYICPDKTKPLILPCLRGTYNLLWNQVSCVTCEAGYQCVGEQRSACPTFRYSLSGWGYCLPSPAGYYIPSGDNSQIVACSAGTYAIYGSGDSTLGSSSCQTCPVGHSCSDPTRLPQPCPPGTYQSSTGQASCLSCSTYYGSGYYSLFHESECHQSPAGFYLPSASRVPRYCPSMHQSGAGATSCTAITAGSIGAWSSAGHSTNEPLRDCQWGFYCSSSGEIPLTLSGSYAAAGTGGYYLASKQTTSLTQCDAGWYCPYGTSEKFACPAGHYCPSGSSLPTPCPATYYNIHIMRTQLSDCTSNTCPAGYYCNEGTKYPQQCVGTCDSSIMYVTAVVTCAAGTYAGNDKPATPGDCNTCWAGYYCEAALASEHKFPTPCPKGTYNPTTGATSSADCLPCDAGVVCPYWGSREHETGLVVQGGYESLAQTTSFRPSAGACPAGKYSDATPFLTSIASCVTCEDGYLCSEATNTLYNPPTLCPIGSYCIAGVETQCPAGTYSTKVGAKASSTCLPCPAGFWCDVGTSDYSLNVCDAGYYCIEGSSVSNPTACPDGTYATATGLKSSSECTICPIGYYCLVGTTTPVACPVGTYSARIALTVEVDVPATDRGCLDCPAGYICPNSPTFYPEACPVGTYSAASAIVCEDCPDGYYCDREATTDTGYVAIEDGFYYTGGPGLAERPYHITSTYSCPPGYWCAGNTKTACVAGTYQPLYGQTSVSSCLTTPAGFFTASDASTGFWDSPCPTGMYCEAGTRSSIGYALADGQANYPILCPKGTFRSQTMGTQLSDCGQCPAGYVCSEFTTDPLICSPGYYCPQGSESMQACPTGTFGSGYGLTTIDDCSPCFGGRYCSSIASAYVSGLCDQMYYCVQSSNTPVPLLKTVGQTTDFLGRIFPVGDECAAGGYCAAGSKFPKPCPAGQYQPNVRAELITECIDCDAGWYCSGAPTTSRTDILPDMMPYVPKATPTAKCYAGYYCTGAAYSPKQFTADPGYYTPTTGYSYQVACTPGYYQPFAAQTGCLDCPPGYYCDTNAMSLPKDCPQGYYCPIRSTSGTANPCPVSTYGQHTNLQEVGDCQACTSGKYCGTTGRTNVQGDCTAGYYCLESATTPTPSGSGTSFGICPAHHWCATGVGMGTPNLQGTINSATHQTAQTTILQTQGYYSYTVSDTSTYFSGPTMTTGQCAVGYYCPAGSSWPFSADYYCTIGQYCPAGSYQATDCPAGTYQPNDLQGTCYTCPAGFYCETTVESDLIALYCPKGYYCPEGTQYATQFACPAGTYNDHYGATSITECVDLPYGYYSAATALTDVTSSMKCTAGYYCTGKSTSPTQHSCVTGYYCPQGTPKMIPCTAGWRCTTGLLSAPNAQCSAGYYCPTGTGSGNGNVCPRGYICPQGSDRPTPCPAGTYQPNQQKFDPSHCTPCQQGYYCPNPAGQSYTSYPCQAGFYCPTGSVKGNVNICQPGYYCPVNSASMIACNNQYQDEYGATFCKNCPAGHICDAISRTKCTPQSEGRNYYCPGGAVSVGSITCPGGTYNFVDGSTSSADCWTCPPGWFCPTNAADPTEKIQICTAGYYCLQGTETPVICPIGYYCPEGTNIPVPCPHGYYGATTGLYTSACSGPCSAGYYCEITYLSKNWWEDASLCIGENYLNCPRGSTSPTQYNCPQGSYCQTGTIIPTPCPIGTYLNYQNAQAPSECIDCTAGQYCYSRGLAAPQGDCQPGYYCEDGSDEATATECPAGSYCPQGSPNHILCPAGTYQPNEVQYSCIPCPKGFYCLTEGLTVPTICPPGYYCDHTNIVDFADYPCPAGSFSYSEGVQSVNNCLQCPFGRFCEWTSGGDPITQVADASECQSGHKCYPASGDNTFTQSDMVACVVGEICATNTAVPTLCPPGTYTDPTATGPGTAESSYCSACPINKYCPDWGLTSANLQNCPDGYVCLGSAIHPSNLDDVTIKLCPVGYYCSQANSNPELPCPVNYYNPKEGQYECQPCPAGHVCESTGISVPEPCPWGYYCPEFDPNVHTTTNKIPCPAGTYSSDYYLYQSSQCINCPPGKYCIEGSSGFTGYCDEGYVCTGGADSPTPTGTFTFDDYANSRSGPCPVGHYCEFGSSYPKMCQPGQYQPNTGQSKCIDCDPFNYCGQAGLSAVSGRCKDGYYCISASVFEQPFDYQTGRICNEGHFCPQGEEIDCYPGQYSPVKGLAVCYTCPPGYYCNADGGTIEPTICTTGHYCPEGSAAPIVCPEGTYTASFQTGLEKKEQCSSCPTGYYCDDGTYDKTKKCAAGYYCLSGAYEREQQGLECPPGYYCEKGTKLPTACPEGTYTLPGAKEEDDCRECLEGYYCVRYKSSSAMVDCPPGFYCPRGANEPIACPKGTFNMQDRAKKLDDCKPCPKGTACDVTGVSDSKRKMCPPGYYCEEGETTPRSCPAGTFRSASGASELGPQSYSLASVGPACYKCVGGYYCPTKATVVPEICPKGYHCPEGSEVPIRCKPGYYCSIGVAQPSPCPKGNFCPGGSDLYYKCPFGTYCPPKSPSPFPCPDGMYGSGSSENFDIESGCRACGRGLYSEDDPTQCLDCLPGYVCTGQTSKARPINNETDRGYLCPPGHYCPLGSFKPTPCPAGTHAKFEGSKTFQQCIPCKFNYYNELPGKGGCKKCGPTSISNGGATTCECIGANRDFIKSTGSCLCSRGYRPKNNGANVDSVEDCEQIVKTICEEGTQPNLAGDCLDAAQQAAECNRQCPSSGGTMVQGTGLCQCKQIVDVNEVCDADCRKKMPIVKLGQNGTMTIADPITGKSQPIEPTQIEGYYGNFKCETTELEQTECNVRTMGMTASGEFTYEFQPNSDLVSKTGKQDYTKELTSERRRQELIKKAGGDRRLQNLVGETTVPRLTNPAMCIKEGDVIFFNVDAPSLNYPVYYKDAFLNNNPDFDYGPFLNLEQMINKGVNVQTFSYVFTQKGTYVFTNKASGTMTTITVVTPAEGCQGAEDGQVGVGMVTKETLSAFGVKSQEKGIQPDWWFISFTIVAILSFLFFALTLFILAHQANIKDTEIFSKDKDIRESAIYYDRTLKRQTYTKYCCGLIRFRNAKVGQDCSSSSDSDDQRQELAIKYNDLEHLLQEFNRAQETLDRQLIDREKTQRTLDQNGELVERLSNENNLLLEVQQMYDFVQKNATCLNNTLGLKSAQVVQERIEQDVNAASIENPMARRMGIALQGLVIKHTAAEELFKNQVASAVQEKQSEAYQAELERNEIMKQKLLDDYQKRLQNIKLNEAERDQLLAELHAKMSLISELAEEEQDRQNHNLQEMLNRRKHRKTKLQVAIKNLNDKKTQEDDHYSAQIMKIRENELREKKKVDDEMADFEKHEMQQLTQQLQKKRLQKTQQAEVKLEAFKRKQGQNFDAKSDIKFANMLTEYGNTVKRVDAELAEEKSAQIDLLHKQIRERKQQRLREIEDQRKVKEEELNKETIEVNKKLDSELKQLESLLTPVKDEQQRMKLILDTERVQDQITFPQSEPDAYHLAAVLPPQDSKEISQLLKKIDTENEVKRREIAQQKQMIQTQLDNAMSDDQRFKLMKQMEKYEAQLKQALQAQSSLQNAQLLEAIESRKAKRRDLMDHLKKEKESTLLSQFKKLTMAKVDPTNDESRIHSLVKRIQAGFSRDESVQVAENVLDEKQQQETFNLMNCLFEERAKALRQLMIDLLSQKQDEFDLLADEYEPQKEFLRQKRVKNLVSLEDFTAALERLTVEETERRQDIEIEFADRERSLRAEIEIIKLESDNDQLKALKDRQTREKVFVFQLMIENTKDMDALQTYLSRAVKEAHAEMEQYRKFADKEKTARLKEMSEAHTQRLDELKAKQARLVNVEEQLKRDEAKYMERFKRQREEMLARKLADQQRELLKEMNQKDVDQMLEKHKKDIAQLDEILADEQSRQMEKMRERMKGRNAERAKQNVVRQIKLAEIQKQKAEERKLAKQYEQAGGDLQTSKALELQKQRVERLTEKAGLMQRMCQKQCYSRRIFFKRHIANQQKLNMFLGRGLTAEWAESAHGSEMDAASGLSQISLKTEDLKAQIREENEALTYATLLKHIERADKDYETLRKQPKPAHH